MRTPVILVAGQKGTDPVVGALLRVPGTLVVEHRFDGHVVRRTMVVLQHGVLTTAECGLELAHGCVSCTMGCPAFPGLRISRPFTRRSVNSGTRCGLRAVSGSRARNEFVDDCSAVRSTSQYRPSLSSLSGTPCSAPAHSSGSRKTIPRAHCPNIDRSARPNAATQARPISPGIHSTYIGCRGRNA